MWEELLKIAMLGTDQTDLPIPLLAELQALGIDINEPPEKILAQGLAYYRMLQKGAANIPVYEGAFPKAIEEGETTVCSPKSSRHLRLILDGTFEAALPEFITLLNNHKRSLPPESLPALLNRCIKDKELWVKIRLAIGNTGQWLIQQNPDWQVLAPLADPKNWLMAEKEERQNILKHWRRTAPSLAIEALEKIWEDLTHTDKTAYLKTFQVGLSLADEDFLEKCLDDGRKPVRQQAVELLSQLPDSLLQQRLFEVAVEIFQYDGNHFQLILPKELSKKISRDGIEKQTKDYLRANRQLGWFLQIIERIPPHRWEQNFEEEPEKIITLAKAADKTKNFIRALARAALLHKDTAWLSAITHHWSIEQEEMEWTSSLGKKVLAGLSDQSANILAIRYLERNEHMLDERSLASQLLLLGGHAWEDRLTLLIVKGFQNWMTGAQNMYGNLWHYKNILSVAAYRCSPDLRPKFQTGWYTSSRIWGLWEADVENFMRVLLFRKEMQTALEEGK